MSLSIPTPTAATKPVLLVVDDEENVRLPMQLAFRSQYTVITARNSAEALAALEKQAVDLVLLDIKLANENGLDVLKLLKAKDPLLEVIMLTGFTTVEYMQQAWSHEAFAFLSKPFDLAATTDVLARAYIHRKRALDAKRALEGMGEENELFHIQNGVIHDITNLLTAISGTACLLHMKVARGPQSDQFLRDSLEALTSQVSLCCKLTHQYFKVIRMVSSGTATVQTQVADICSNLFSLLKTHTGLRNASFHFINVSPNPVVTVPALELFQVLLNLAINAAQSTAKQHTVSVEVADCAPPDIAVMQDSPTTRVIGVPTFVLAPRFVKIVVRDFGNGIQPDTLAKLFKNYHTTKPEGTGIGLPLVATFVAKHKMLLYLQTAPNKGTTVTLFVPAAS